MSDSPHSEPLAELREFFRVNAMSESPQMRWLDDLEEQLEAARVALSYYAVPLTDNGAVARVVLNGEKPPEHVFQFFRELHAESSPASELERGWLTRYEETHKEICVCGWPEKDCLRRALRNGPPYPPKPCEPREVSVPASEPEPS